MKIKFKRILRNIPIVRRIYTSFFVRLLKLINKEIFLVEFMKTKFELDINEPIDKSILLFDYYEDKQINYTAELMRKYNVNIFFDIGANCGLYSLIIANKFNKINIYSFEPVETSYKKLIKNISINKNTENIKIYNYELPLNEVVFDFNDRLKSMTSGYASFDYELIGHREGELVKMGILVNTEPVDALAMMIHKDFAQKTGREVCEKLKDLIPRHNFMIPVQAAIGGKIIARETIKGFKKDVLTKIHGGGATDRKRKLLEKQKKGKARAKQFGKVEIPQEAFIGVLKISKEK